MPKIIKIYKAKSVNNNTIESAIIDISGKLPWSSSVSGLQEITSKDAKKIAKILISTLPESTTRQLTKELMTSLDLVPMEAKCQKQ